MMKTKGKVLQNHMMIPLTGNETMGFGERCSLQ